MALIERACQPGSAFISLCDHQQAKAKYSGKAVCDQIGRARIHHASGQSVSDAKAVLNLAQSTTPPSDESKSSSNLGSGGLAGNS